MMAVIFEVWPNPDAKATYFDIAAELRPLLAEIDGFISIERFQSLTDPDKLLSLSFWHDEAAIAEWRKRDGHRGAQSDGRSGVLKEYRLRVGYVVRDYGRDERDEAPADSRAIHG